ncbi:MAG TPA: 4a-hydroxytetrahydrobiopterin dehydratase [Lentisphaeria bacterium]|nr:MAG: 4a-hydroxytetrahydrobiopterin dehydratase [Lentisphaerae bacterium GWF2_50_93]HCE45682.1 4a-hydroxytetrahydrobiopterin dehydratase [Lentisphaeria bacterium]
MSKLTEKKCEPCSGGVEPLAGEKICMISKQISTEWKVVEEHHLAREFKFINFVEALKFVNKVGCLAESEKHHPDIHLSWGKVKIEIYTHKIDGLHENDFILAAKIDKLMPGTAI